MIFDFDFERNSTCDYYSYILDVTSCCQFQLAINSIVHWLCHQGVRYN